MSVLKEPTLSIIDEATEQTESDWHSSRHEPVIIPETFEYAEQNRLSATQIPRVSILSSETSYGDPLPPGQSTFRSLGLGVFPAVAYEKSLPSLPRGSVAKSASARSGLQTESARGSVAKSESSRHSVVKSEGSRHSAVNSVPFKFDTAKQETLNHSSAKSKSSRGSLVLDPVAAALPSLLHKTSSPSSSSTSSSSVTSASSSSSSNSTFSTSSQSTLRTFDDVVDEVASSLALRTKMRAETMATSDHTKIGVCATMLRTNDQRFMRILADKIHQAMALQSSYLFALIPSVVGGPAEFPATLVFCGAPQHLVTKASILAGLRFKTRLAELQDSTGTWIGYLEGHPAGREYWDPHAHDEDLLWDIVRKAANPVDPGYPPPGSRGIDQLLTQARARLDRLSPRDAFNEALQDGILVDIRPEAQRVEYGSIPGAVIIERNVLEWRFDPRSLDGRLPIADRYDLRVIIYCQEGYTSSLAAAALQDIGLWRATDIDGGFMKWKNEGLPTNMIQDDARSVHHRSVSPSSPK